jgi:hypothetical protein
LHFERGQRQEPASNQQELSRRQLPHLPAKVADSLGDIHHDAGRNDAFAMRYLPSWYDS